MRNRQLHSTKTKPKTAKRLTAAAVLYCLIMSSPNLLPSTVWAQEPATAPPPMTIVDARVHLMNRVESLVTQAKEEGYCYSAECTESLAQLDLAAKTMGALPVTVTKTSQLHWQATQRVIQAIDTWGQAYSADILPRLSSDELVTARGDLGKIHLTRRRFDSYYTKVSPSLEPNASNISSLLNKAPSGKPAFVLASCKTFKGKNYNCNDLNVYLCMIAVDAGAVACGLGCTGTGPIFILCAAACLTAQAAGLALCITSNCTPA